jgi:hypothetical protein
MTTNKHNLTTPVAELPGIAPKRDLAAIVQEARNDPGTWLLVHDEVDPPRRARSARTAAHLREYGIEVAIRSNVVYVRATPEK